MLRALARIPYATTLQILGGLFALLAIALGIAPSHRADWLLENGLVVLFLAAAAVTQTAGVRSPSNHLARRALARPDTEARANLRAVDSQSSITLAPSTPVLAVPSEIPAPEASPSSASDVGSPASGDASVTAQDPAAHSDDAVERGPEARASRRRTQGTRRPRTPHGPITQTPF